MPHKRSTLFLAAHIVGLPERPDPLPGATDHLESSSRTFSNSTRDNKSAVAVRVSFKIDPATEPLRNALLGTVAAVQECYTIFRRLGLPERNLINKLPFHKEAFKDPGKAVMLDGSTQRMLKAKQTGVLDTQNLTYRPKPKFLTREPGIKTILAFNISFVLWLMYG